MIGKSKFNGYIRFVSGLRRFATDDIWETRPYVVGASVDTPIKILLDDNGAIARGKFVYRVNLDTDTQMIYITFGLEYSGVDAIFKTYSSEHHNTGLTLAEVTHSFINSDVQTVVSIEHAALNTVAEISVPNQTLQCAFKWYHDQINRRWQFEIKMNNVMDTSNPVSGYPLKWEYASEADVFAAGDLSSALAIAKQAASSAESSASQAREAADEATETVETIASTYVSR